MSVILGISRIGAMCFLLCTAALLAVPAQGAMSGIMKEIHISASGGSDNASGTEAAPFRTPHRAAAEVARHTGTMTGDIIVCLHEGTYELDSTVQMGPSHGGRGDHWVIWRSFGTEKAVISGGRKIAGTWEKVEGSKQWKVEVPTYEKKMRNLYVNGTRATMANGKMLRWGADWRGEGLFYKDEQVTQWKNHRDIELHQQRSWIFHVFSVKELVPENGGTAIRMQQPMWNIGQTVGWVTPDHNWGWSVHNVHSLLDRDGEFYFDRSIKTLFYQPLAGEEPNASEVIVPMVEELFRIEGKGLTSKVKNLQMWGLTFAHSDWQLLNIENSFGATTTQANTVYFKLTESGNWHDHRYNNIKVTPAAVEINHADNIIVNRNRFVHLGSSGFNATNGVTRLQVVGNTFEDISATAISIGCPQHVILGDEGRLHPEEQNPQQVKVSNNLLRDVATEFIHCPGITVFFVEDIDVMHNDIGPMVYSQISAGWGWINFPDATTSRNNRISYNKLVAPCQGLGDGGSIYTLGVMEGNSEVRGNYMSIPAPYKTSGMKWALYADQGFSSKLWTNNVIEDFEIWLNKLRDAPARLDSNYTTTNQQECRSNCPTNTFSFSKANRPKAVLDIIAKAGIEPAYQQAWDGSIPEIDPQTIGVAEKTVAYLKAAAPSARRLRNQIWISAGAEGNLPLTCRLFDMKGRQIVQMVMTGRNSSMSLPMMQGTYMLSIAGSKGVVHRKFVTVQ